MTRFLISAECYHFQLSSMDVSTKGLLFVNSKCAQHMISSLSCFVASVHCSQDCSAIYSCVNYKHSLVLAV